MTSRIQECHDVTQPMRERVELYFEFFSALTNSFYNFITFIGNLIGELLNGVQYTFLQHAVTETTKHAEKGDMATPPRSDGAPAANRAKTGQSVNLVSRWGKCREIVLC